MNYHMWLFMFCSYIFNLMRKDSLFISLLIEMSSLWNPDHHLLRFFLLSLFRICDNCVSDGVETDN